VDLQTIVVGVLVVTCSAFALRGLLRQGKAAMSGCNGCGKCTAARPASDVKPIVFYAKQSLWNKRKQLLKL
jgi:ferredoxin